MLGMFGLGTMPGLLATQFGWSALAKRVQPQRLSYWRRGIAIVAGIVLVARSLADIDIATLISTGEFCY